MKSSRSTKEKLPHVVIVGAGFGGLAAARVFKKNPNCKVTIIDRRNHHLFQPLLYQVATAGLSPADIAFPIRSEFSNSQHIEVLLGEVQGIDCKKSQVFLKTHTISYDYLILAGGAEQNYFGKNEWENWAPTLKTLQQATEIRRRILLAYENAESQDDASRRRALMTFVVVGGGPTGVELAGAIAELSRYTLVRDFRRINPSQTRILLVEAGERVLSSFPEKLSLKAQDALESFGVEIKVKTRVENIGPSGIRINGEWVDAETVIWAAGVKPSSLGENLKTECDKVGRVHVLEDLRVRGFSNVFVIGDMAHFQDQSGEPLPGLASVALQQGKFAAKNIERLLNGQNCLPFRYRDKGQMATIGRKKAIAETPFLNISGFIAWLLWLVIHIYYLIGFKNKIFVFLQWIWSYFSYKRGARLIVDNK